MFINIYKRRFYILMFNKQMILNSPIANTLHVNSYLTTI